MGEEEKKPAAAEEVKKTEEVKKEEEKPEEKKEEESKEEASPQPQPQPPPPPQEIILKVYMHCEGCARKVRRCLKGFPGVEDVLTDCKSHKVVVKGEKADPLMVLDRVQRKSHRKVELISPIPKPPPAEEEKKPEEEKPKPEEKKEEPQAMIVVLSIHMHCEACAQQMKKLILRMKGVDSAESDLKSSQVKVQGVFDPEKLVGFVYKRSGKRGVIVSQEPVKKEEKPEEAKEEPKKEEKEEAATGAGGDNNKAPAEEEKKEEAPAASTEEGKAEAEAAAAAAPPEANPNPNPDEMKMMVEAKKLEYLYYPPPRYAMEYYAPAPQIFSDENPNACSVM